MTLPRVTPLRVGLVLGVGLVGALGYALWLLWEERPPDLAGSKFPWS